VSHKINELNGNGPAAGTSLGASRTKGTAAVASPEVPTNTETAGGAGDVHITDTATWLATLESGLRDSPAVDPARVAATRSLLEQGKYTVQPEHVAASLMQVEQALGGLAAKVPAAGSADES